MATREESGSVAVVGDYDVDGVSGTALLSAVLRGCGVTVHPIVPHRLRDGYGFQPVHVERAVELGCRLLITVDCGSSSHRAVTDALDAGLEVVITDHHLPSAPLPEGAIQINPRQDGCDYPFAELSGAGLALKLALAVAEACDRPIDPRKLMRIACLGTIADLVPLTGENRVIAALGLGELHRTRSAGLRALFEVAGLRPPYSASDVGFRIGPRLNAPGRLDSAEKSLELLLCTDPGRASELAGELDRCNRERQELERRVTAEAREELLARPELPPFLVAWSEGWHRGVVGIAAGRLAKEFQRPALLLAVDGDLATGSGRSIPGIHLHRFLAPWRDRLAKFGGHAQAIGMSVTPGSLAELRDQWQAAAGEGWRELIGVRRYEYELDLAAGEVGAELLRRLARLAPHGPANPLPLIRVRGPLRVLGPPRRFGRGHLSAQAAGQGGTIRLLGWGWQEREDDLAAPFEALGYLELDRYRGGPRLRLVDARPWAEDGTED